MSETLLQVRDLKVYYPVKTQSIIPRKVYVKAVDGISFDVRRKEAFGIVGESGCGKSTTGHAIVGLLKPTSGQILFEGQSIVGGAAISKERAKKLQIIFQDPYSSLDSRFTVGRCISEPLEVHKIGTAKERLERVEELMGEVGLNHEQITRYPHEFSGGQRQRIGIARALALNPSLIICDEPVSALDVSIQAQILNLMQELKEKHGLTYIFISHNLSVVHHLCDRIAVMYLGNIVEIAEKRLLFDHPLHPYTQALLDAIPIPDPDRDTMNSELEGDVPSPLNPPSGCCFHTRCRFADQTCAQAKPQLAEAEDGHLVACHKCRGKG
ncbi:MAG: ATP-binding cassette domain-containing protein [Angelakisella sp.]|jgi:oligopeptide/dipeptide ABC transporter ATP-binding protein|nr:ATP-binding cassette domain-containing protein [Angelakisella sp.]